MVVATVLQSPGLEGDEMRDPRLDPALAVRAPVALVTDTLAHLVALGGHGDGAPKPRLDVGDVGGRARTTSASALGRWLVARPAAAGHRLPETPPRPYGVEEVEEVEAAMTSPWPDARCSKKNPLKASA